MDHAPRAFLATVERAVRGKGEAVGAIGVLAAFRYVSARRLVAENPTLGDRGKEHAASVPGEAAGRPPEGAGDFSESPDHVSLPGRDTRYVRAGAEYRAVRGGVKRAPVRVAPG